MPAAHHLARRSARPVPVLQDAFNPRSNSLNFLRLGLAVAVIVSHTWPLGGFGQDPHWGSSVDDLGDWSVDGFFVISGWLITTSRESSDPGTYLRKRFLRIYPGFMAGLLVMALLFAPLASRLEHSTWSLSAAARFVLQGSGLYIFNERIGTTLASNPLPGSWNGQLWTLFYEAGCYLAIGVLVSIVPRRHLARAAITVWLATSAGHIFVEQTHVLPLNVVGEIAGGSLRLASFFFAGATLYLLRDRVTSSPWLAFAALDAVLVVVLGSQTATLAALPLAYLAIWLATRLPLQKVGRRNDFSYGVYIYGWPVQQILAASGLQTGGPLGFLVLALIFTAPLAVASWFLVEKPCARRRKVPRARGWASAKRPTNLPVTEGALSNRPS